jgi:adenylate cyclase
MNLPTDSQWARYSILCRRLEPLPTPERAAVLQQLHAAGDEDPQVLSLVALHCALPPDSARDRTGDRLGDFTLEECLGAGGMGVVYQAQQHMGATTRPVVVKLIHPTWLRTAREQALAQFQAELGTLVKLEHESIARIYGGGIAEDPITHESLPYIAMELVRGGLPLTTYARDYALAWPERLALFLRVCRAIQYAHEHRVMHRDLKPTNILVDLEGHPTVIDFGLACVSDALLPGAHLVAAGTPAYMSPEQVSDAFGPISTKSDVYALGLILYELLTEQLPYVLPRDGTVEELCQMMTAAMPPPLSQHDPAYGRDLDAIVAAALAKRPGDRLSVAVLRSRLERSLQQLPPDSDRPRRPTTQPDLEQASVGSPPPPGPPEPSTALPPAAIDNTEGPVIMASSDEPAPRVTPGITRRLAAILSADVAGYSRLMGEDEEATVRTVTVYRDVIATLVQQHRGRVVDAPGDNVLAEFASVLDAVQCAVAIQQELNARNAALPLPRRMQFRLGLNLGDVIPDGERIYGDGVNIAARLEGLAEAGGICISGTVYDQVATKLPLTYKFLGRQTVKNIARPVRAYRVQASSGPADRKGRLRNWRGAGPRPRMALAVVGLLLLLGGGVVGGRLFLPPSGPTTRAPAQQTAARALLDKPSIAVLPFVNMSDDPGQEYFSDGMTEDLITDLSRLMGLFVIARNTVFTYKGKAVKTDQVGQELRVQYILEGSVRKANGRMRITAQLVDAATGYHLWAERYDRDVQDIFAVQEEIAARITKALAVQLTVEEKEQMGRPYTSSTVAWELFMQGTAYYRKYTPKDNATAREFFKRAIQEDPEFVRAIANLSATHRQDWTFAWVPDLDAAKREARNQADRAVRLAQSKKELAPSLPYAYQQLAYMHMYSGEVQEAVAKATEAVKLASQYADGYAALAQMLIYDGQPQAALAAMEEAKKWNPKPPAYYHYHIGQAYYVLGVLEQQTDHFETAISHLQKALEISANFRPARAYLAAVYVELGQLTEAQNEMKTLQSMVPGRNKDLFTDSQRVAPFRMPEITERLLRAWEQAGA